MGRYFVDGGIDRDRPFRSVAPLSLNPSERTTNLIAAANFVEVFLTKEGHHGLIGIDYVEKLQMATPAPVYGATSAYWLLESVSSSSNSLTQFTQ